MHKMQFPNVTKYAKFIMGYDYSTSKCKIYKTVDVQIMQPEVPLHKRYRNHFKAYKAM
jgi:hypothetical protein